METNGAGKITVIVKSDLQLRCSGLTPGVLILFSGPQFNLCNQLS